jgi:hypothetical protein
MRMANETLRYIKLDYQSQKDALLQRIHDRWPTRWNDFLANSFGIVLVDLVAWAFATNAYVINKIAGENYVSTMSLRESAVRLGSLTGYKLKSPIPSTVMCEASIPTASNYDVTIAKGTVVRSSDTLGLSFETENDYVIYSGYLTPRTLITTFSPNLSGINVIGAYLNVVQGSSIVTPTDTSIDLSDYIDSGVSLIDASANDKTETNYYTVSELTTLQGSTSNYNQIVLDRAWTGATGRIEAKIYDRRIELIQGQTVTETFSAPDNSIGYSVNLSQTPVIDGSVKAYVNGSLWQQADSLGVNDASAEVYQVKTYTSGSTAILFGDDTFSAAVPAEAVITIVYRIGGGLNGNIALGAINTTITGIIASQSNPITITVTNSTATGQGGQDAETLNQARVNIPYYTRTNNRAVTLDDYQTLSQQYTGIAYARAAVRTENALLEGNIVTIYAWTTGSDGGLVTLNTQTKSNLCSYLQSKSVGTDFVQVLDGTSRPVPISLQFKASDGFSITDVKESIDSSLTTIINNLRPGDPIILSNLISDLNSVTGVDSLTIATPQTDLYPSNSLELFTSPQSGYSYLLDKQSNGSVTTDSATLNVYNVQFPVYPLQAWSFTLTLGGNDLSVMPYIGQDSAGNLLMQQARIIGNNISDNADYPSTLNLLTGQATLYIVGAPGDLTLQLIAVNGYSAVKNIKLYIGYKGDVSQAKRREIRAALKTWGQGFGIGGTIYASPISGISASVVNVQDILATIPGVDSVNRVALDKPSASDLKITAADYELLQIGDIILNNNVD